MQKEDSMNQDILLKLNDIIKPDLIKMLSSKDDNISMIDKIIRTIGIDTVNLSEKEIENIISNYVFISEKIRLDLIEIDERIREIKHLDIDGVEEYTRRKYRYFSQLNKTAQDEIISFINTKFISYLLDKKTVDYYSRQWDEGLMLMLNSIYEYAWHKRYFDYTYDFSSEAKFRFTPGINVFQAPQIISEYASLKKSCIDDYYAKIHKNVVDTNLPNYLSNMVYRNYYISKRSETFDTLNILYNDGKYQSFISLAIIQIEGLFHDFCVLNSENNFLDRTGTLVEKAEKTLTAHQHYRLAIYPYYAFDAPVMRNEIAHKGIMEGSNLEQIADEILMDLHSIITLICNKINDKYFALFTIYEKLELLEDKSECSTVITFVEELFASSQVHSWESVRILREPDKYKKEYFEGLSLIEFCQNHYEKNIDDIIQCLHNLIFGGAFWETLKDQIQSAIKAGIEHKSGQLYDFIDFAIAMKNDFIGKLPNETEAKESCKQLAALLKPFEN